MSSQLSPEYYLLQDVPYAEDSGYRHDQVNASDGAPLGDGFPSHFEESNIGSDYKHQFQEVLRMARYKTYAVESNIQRFIPYFIFLSFD